MLQRFFFPRSILRGVEISKNRYFSAKTKVLAVESVKIGFCVKNDAERSRNYQFWSLRWRVMKKNVFFGYFADV